jgi:hypothetical protein
MTAQTTVRPGKPSRAACNLARFRMERQRTRFCRLNPTHFRCSPTANCTRSAIGPTPRSQVAAGVYTIWRGPRLVYVGMSGRSLTGETILEQRSAGARGKGLFSRLNSHACGRRSGDQFCIYIADRLVLTGLSPQQIAEIGSGALALDALVRAFIREHLTYRFLEVADGGVARAIEIQIRRGCLPSGPPLLNPV